MTRYAAAQSATAPGSSPAANRSCPDRKRHSPIRIRFCNTCGNSLTTSSRIAIARSQFVSPSTRRPSRRWASTMLIRTFAKVSRPRRRTFGRVFFDEPLEDRPGRLVLLQGLLLPSQPEEDPAEAVVAGRQVDGRGVLGGIVVHHLLPCCPRLLEISDRLLGPTRLLGHAALAEDRPEHLISADRGKVLHERLRDRQRRSIRRERLLWLIQAPQQRADVGMGGRIAQAKRRIIAIGGVGRLACDHLECPPLIG